MRTEQEIKELIEEITLNIKAFQREQYKPKNYLKLEIYNSRISECHREIKILKWVLNETK